jgi:hypothetical protein
MEFLMLLAVLLPLYFAPTIYAAPARRESVFMVNLYLGWSLIGWGFAMYLAARSNED